jgi:hypothetical protein
MQQRALHAHLNLARRHQCPKKHRDCFGAGHYGLGLDAAAELLSIQAFDGVYRSRVFPLGWVEAPEAEEAVPGEVSEDSGLGASRPPKSINIWKYSGFVFLQRLKYVDREQNASQQTANPYKQRGSKPVCQSTNLHVIDQ